MDGEAPVTTGRRPRAWLLIALGVTVLGLLAAMMWPDTSATGPEPSSNPTRTAQARNQSQQSLDPTALDVRLERLEASRPGPEEDERNPFRFRQQAPSPQPPLPKVLRPDASMQPVPPGPPLPPAPPPISLKFMGIVVRQDGRQVAQLSDCRGTTFQEVEGGIIDGRYRVVKIGLESIVIEQVDGKARQTIRLEGCPPRT